MTKLLNVYIERLQKYGEFSADIQKNQLFSYADNATAELEKLRLEFCVSDIIKGSSVFQKTVSLMNWVHKELFYVGSNVSPNGNNTFDIMSVRKTGALFCWYHAIVLTEMLGSIGIAARVISCLPEIFDYDSHMAVLVYDNDTSHWFFVDPTFNTYFYSDNDKALDVFQIREIYKSGKTPLFKHISIDKQWDLVCNGIICETYDQWYTIYMAKNTFRFMSPAHTYFNCLSDDNLLWIAINPPCYKQINEYDKDKNIMYIYGITDFLQKP
jgi:hypothetical protein